MVPRFSSLDSRIVAPGVCQTSGPISCEWSRQNTLQVGVNAHRYFVGRRV